MKEYLLIIREIMKEVSVLKSDCTHTQLTVELMLS